MTASPITARSPPHRLVNIQACGLSGELDLVHSAPEAPFICYLRAARVRPRARRHTHGPARQHACHTRITTIGAAASILPRLQCLTSPNSPSRFRLPMTKLWKGLTSSERACSTSNHKPHFARKLSPLGLLALTICGQTITCTSISLSSPAPSCIEFIFTSFGDVLYLTAAPE